MKRYVAESSFAVLDTKTGFREWFDSHRETLETAERKNAAYDAYIAYEKASDVSHSKGMVTA